MAAETALNGKYVAYPEYKNSGVEWLGEIPKEWQVKRLKYICKVQTGTRDTVNAVDGGSYPFYVRSQTVERINSFGADCEAVLTAGDGVGVGKVFHYFDGRFDYHQRVYMLNSFNHVIGRFVYYYLSNNFFKVALEGSAKSTVDSLRLPQFLNFEFSLPSTETQQKIVNFLDHETAKIDTLIEKQQQLIKLLNEKRQAVISHVVTRGLPSTTGSDTPMRDSGVDWLCEVPEHWEVKRLKHISPKIGVGLVINPSTYTKEEGVYFIFGGDVKEYNFDLSKTRKISPEDSDSLLPSRLNHRDLVSVRVGYPGITAVVTEDLEGSNCASVIVIRRGDYNSDWLCAAMNVWVGRQQVDLVSYGAAQKQFNVADAIDFVFPVPPEREQVEIASYIKKSLNQFNTLSDKAEHQIKLLQERRTALISAAVTGKIDVRGWLAPKASSADDHNSKSEHQPVATSEA